MQTVDTSAEQMLKSGIIYSNEKKVIKDDKIIEY